MLAVAAFLLIGGRAIALASTAGDLTGIAAGQQRSTHTLPAHRGAIYDREGHELAVGELRETVYATPYLIDDPYAAARHLCRALKVTNKTEQLRILRVLSDKESGFAYIARKADPDRAKRALALDIPGVGSYPEEKRVYPMRGVAAQLVGFAGVDNIGLAGIEQRCEDTLRGTDGRETVVRDPEGRTLKVLQNQPSVPGTSVRLTIDADIQLTAEEVLERTVRDFGAKAATARRARPAQWRDPRHGERAARRGQRLRRRTRLRA